MATLNSSCAVTGWLPRERFLALAGAAYDVVKRVNVPAEAALDDDGVPYSDAGTFAEELAIELRELLYELESGAPRYLLEPAAYGFSREVLP